MPSQEERGKTVFGACSKNLTCAWPHSLAESRREKKGRTWCENFLFPFFLLPLPSSPSTYSAVDSSDDSAIKGWRAVTAVFLKDGAKPVGHVNRLSLAGLDFGGSQKEEEIKKSLTDCPKKRHCRPRTKERKLEEKSLFFFRRRRVESRLYSFITAPGWRREEICRNEFIERQKGDG